MAQADAFGPRGGHRRDQGGERGIRLTRQSIRQLDPHVAETSIAGVAQQTRDLAQAGRRGFARGGERSEVDPDPVEAECRPVTQRMPARSSSSLKFSPGKARALVWSRKPA